MKRRYHRTNTLIAAILVSTLCTATVWAQVATPSSEPAESAGLVPPVRPTSTGVAVSSSRNLSMSYSLGMPGQAPVGTAMLVLTEAAEGGQIETLTEDLNIMCRVFDRNLKWASSQSQGYGVLIPSGAASPAHHFFGAYGPATHCLYVQDHGPLFFLSVNFPLAPSTERDETTPSKDTADPVWQEVAKDLYRPGASREHEPQKRRPPYDREKVITLENNITHSLKHAANIRDLKGDELVTVVVRSREAGPQGPYGMPLFDNAGATSDVGSTLIMCATVKDIQEYAAGTLSLPEFEPRVQCLQR